MPRMNRDLALITIGLAVARLENVSPPAGQLCKELLPLVEKASQFLLKYHGEPKHLDPLSRRAVSFIMFSMLILATDRACEEGGQYAGEDPNARAKKILEMYPGWNRELMRQTRAIKKPEDFVSGENSSG